MKAKSNSRYENVPFNLTIDDIPEIPTVCPILGIPVQLHRNHPRPNSISIDRIVPREGYVDGNILLISYRANALKKDATVAEMESIINYMEENI